METNKPPRILFCLTAEDATYQKYLGKVLGKNIAGHRLTFNEDFPTQRTLENTAKDFDYIVTTSPKVATTAFGFKFRATEQAEGTRSSGASMNDYAGSIIKLKGSQKEVLILNPLKHLVTVPHAEFLFKRYLSKFFSPETWPQQTPFKWTVINTKHEYNEAVSYLESSEFIAFDIENGDGLRIKMIGFCGARINDLGFWETQSFVLPLRSPLEVSWMRNILMIPRPKATQNGLYDLTWLLTYNTPVYDWRLDTLAMFQSWYSELPRTLAFITTFLLRDVQFWKDDASSGNFEDECKYNARDTWATANSVLAWFREAPAFAKENYKITWNQVYPALECNIEGLKVDQELKKQIKEEQEQINDRELESLRKCLNLPDFNPNSPKQVKNLLHMLGYKKVTSADIKTLENCARNHPLTGYLINKIIASRKARKLLSTYIDVPLLKGRFLYALNPFGTETSRFSAAKGHLYYMQGTKYIHYGQQIQNLPPYVKRMLIADDGYHLAEMDKKASESWCVAFLANEPNLKRVLSTEPDFHKANAEMFFGIPKSEITKDIRTIAKKINHAANYNMQENTLVVNMTEPVVWEAKQFLLDSLKDKTDAQSVELRMALIRSVSAPMVAKVLLSRFHHVYPMIKGRWYAELVLEIKANHTLVSPTGWTRYCFGNPENINDFNAYIAHKPQHTSSILVGRAFYKFQQLVNDGKLCRLKAVIHDSIVFQYKIGHEYILDRAMEMMDCPIIVRGDTLNIPSDIKFGDAVWANLKERS